MSKVSRIVLVFIFLGALAWALVANAPARLALAYANNFFPDLYASGVSGTVWQGKAASMLIRLNGTVHDLGKVSWGLSKWPLLWGDVNVKVKTVQAEMKTDFKAQINLVSKNANIKDMVFTVPASMVRQYSPLPFTMKGILDGRVEQAYWQDQTLSDAKGNVVWKDAVVNIGSGDQALGDFLTEFKNLDDQSLLLDISELKGHLGLNGQITLAADQRSYQADVSFKPDEQLDGQLKMMLSQLGSPDSQGLISFKHKGRL